MESRTMPIAAIATFAATSVVAPAAAQPGTLDPGFGGNGTVTVGFDLGGGGADSLNALAVQPDGRILAAGFVAGTAGDDDFGIARLDPDGSLDSGFGLSGRAVIPFDLGGSLADIASAVAVQPDGRIVLCGTAIAGAHADVAVARLTAAGALDPTFGTSGRISFGTQLGGPLTEFAFDCVLDASGRIVLAGWVLLSSTNSDFLVARLLSDGSLDLSLSADGVTTVPFDLGGSRHDQPRAIAVQPNGRIVIVGLAEDADPDYEIALARLLTNGSLDATFGSGGRVTLALDRGGDLQDTARGVALTPAGRIVIAGTSAGTAGWDFLAARFLADGTLDPRFGGTGWAAVGFDLGGNLDDEGWALALQDDGKVLVIGGVETDNPSGSGDRDFGAVRLNVDGTLDLGFGSSGRAVVASGPDPSFLGRAEAVALQPDGRIVLGNETSEGNVDFLLARLDNDFIFTAGFESGDTSSWSTAVP